MKENILKNFLKMRFINNMPLFTIVIPTFNREKLLPVALDSILNQSFEDWECIVVDDGSTDNTKELVHKYINRDNRFKYIYQENAERSAARNNGIENAKGKWICFLDSDDYFLNNRLENFYQYINENKLNNVLIFSGIAFTSDEEYYEREVTIDRLLEINVFDYLAKTIIGTPQLCVSSNILQELKFNTNFRFSEDLELCFRIARHYKLIPQPKNITVVALEHTGRTVGYTQYNTSAEQIKTWKAILNKNHSGKRISRTQKKWVLSHLFFNEAKYFMYNNKKANAIKKIILAILIYPNEDSNRHRLYCLIKLLTFRVPLEYNIKKN
jgi:glycosyltransferase involved in cell wall biosynthesis